MTILTHRIGKIQKFLMLENIIHMVNTMIYKINIRKTHVDITDRACNETNLMHYLSLVYSVTTILRVSGLLVAHHPEVTSIYVTIGAYCTYNTYQFSHFASSPSSGGNNVCMKIGACCTYNNCHIYTLLPPDDGLLASSKNIEIW
jgi:hypothetical protein